MTFKGCPKLTKAQNLYILKKQRAKEKLRCKICGTIRQRKNLTGGLCYKCFNAVENECKHSGEDWNEGIKIVRAQA